MSDRIQHFLLVFDHSVGRLLHTSEFGEDADAALAAYASTEADFSGRKDIEVVLIGSDSFETVKRTHANYFDGSDSVSVHLAGI